ncbi:bifunctional 6-phosphofructo-2-kinase fructose-2,6-bisphosphate 2-phosphatase [Lecanosticta acicola]|uniref:Bifunctional 6-phosphofructo-2-kinase fructose-2,6-bisphosphate 2-phosphatase n=1 Tax=Lecanosticta acicola TaxID=111012 RepID=A0AAI9E895_9PEZI|nr:bifunctional 6-phosphofructo-2-kinase fructose-2,6-bisphosphate 2-phosphatase [Lecanosticta acicola]
MTTSRAQSEERHPSDEVPPNDERKVDQLRNQLDRTLSGPSGGAASPKNGVPPPQHDGATDFKAIPRTARGGSLAAAVSGHFREVNGATMAMNDTPATTAPSSPRLNGNTFAPGSVGSVGSDGPPPKLPTPVRQNSGTSTPRVRPTTLDIPGLTKSKVSPDGRIASRDVGSKLVIVMVGLPARGKSYITKKLARYLNWLQHDTRIFNVGERRRVAAGGPNCLEKTKSQQLRDERHDSQRQSTAPSATSAPKQTLNESTNPTDRHASVAHILLNDDTKLEPPATPPATEEEPQLGHGQPNGHRKQSMATIVLAKDAPDGKTQEEEEMEQNAAFFDPQNKKASQIREQVARETLDELLDYILYENGSVGILDATNSTMERRKMVMDRIRERAGPQLNVLFLESSCVDQDLLEANMRLKLNGPDYREMDPIIALKDFKKRVREYEKAYVPLGEYEEKNNMPYIQMVDVGRKVISHQIKGFLMAQANYYLLNFNLAPRQIWITRHGLSLDNLSGKIGGDSDLSPEGQRYARSLANFMDAKRKEWDVKQIQAMKNTHFPPQPGDSTPPNPFYNPQSPGSDADSIISDATNEMGYEPKAFCVWTSMLKRSIQSAQYFNDEDYDTKQMRMLDELNAGVMEGLTYNCISSQYPDEYKTRKADKLHYRYPGPGGEGYLDVINRLRPVIVELERMTDHVLLIGHRSVARVLLAYFRGLKREEVADLDVPIGLLYCLEPKPYGVDFKVYKWDKETEWFYEQPDFQLKRAEDDMI